MTRVFIADDHGIVRDGLRRLLEDTDDMQVAGEASDGIEVVRRAAEEEWDVLLLDLSLPGLSGVEILARLKSIRPALKVLVLSMYPEDQHGPHLLRAGASGYLTKGRGGVEVLEALRTVARGGTYVTDVVARHLFAGESAPHEGLSRREYEIFMMLANGRMPSEIAAALNLGATTVSTYVARIRQKLGARTLNEIVQYAYRYKLAQ
jgi:DNA-binding NarL/FixJ family response regulator